MTTVFDINFGPDNTYQVNGKPVIRWEYTPHNSRFSFFDMNGKFLFYTTSLVGTRGQVARMIRSGELS